ncbi:hypothetical protein SDC9_205805 [bioreactor metagenome]|uniref:Uncharacterized protein n=1 Tax=bioreactor metagenome TaxID=1076179 RepID=A0A645JCH3_9ZZZZ
MPCTGLHCKVLHIKPEFQQTADVNNETPVDEGICLIAMPAAAYAKRQPVLADPSDCIDNILYDIAVNYYLWEFVKASVIVLPCFIITG